MAKNGDDWMLFLCESDDNITYTTPTEVILPCQDSWDERLYRSSIVNVGDTMRIYYSASTNYNIWGIGITESLSSNNKFIGKNY